MKVYFSQRTLTGDVPENVEKFVKNTFTKYEVEHQPERVIVVKVPSEELKIVKNFTNNVQSLLKAIEKENKVLAEKLANSYGFKLR